MWYPKRGFHKKSVFDSSLQDIAQGFVGNKVCLPAELDAGYKTSILKSYWEKVVYKLRGATWKHPYMILGTLPIVTKLCLKLEISENFNAFPHTVLKMMRFNDFCLYQKKKKRIHSIFHQRICLHWIWKLVHTNRLIFSHVHIFIHLNTITPF